MMNDTSQNKSVQHFKSHSKFKKKSKTKIELPCYPAVSLLGIYLEKTCTSLFIAALLTMAMTWKQMSVHRGTDKDVGTSLVIQWLRLHAPNAGAQV